MVHEAQVMHHHVDFSMKKDLRNILDYPLNLFLHACNLFGCAILAVPLILHIVLHLGDFHLLLLTFKKTEQEVAEQRHQVIEVHTFVVLR